MYNTDTIVAQASPSGRGGVSVIRISGKKSIDLAKNLFKKQDSFFQEKKALLVSCFSKENELIDEGLMIYFKAPKSFTGEDVVEFQCHGSPMVVDAVLEASIGFGARMALPGEFSERAFLNGKIDLLQAEAIADLIDSQSKQAAKNAAQTLKGVFSERIHQLNEQLIQIRMYLEATIDFPDEESVDFIEEGKIKEKIEKLLALILQIKKEAEQGQILQEGIRVVLAGEPNAGKSSLLNYLVQKESAIVTEIAGTTRDILKENILINGIPINIIDTAGLRESEDLVEQEGIRRAWLAIEEADIILYLVDTRDMQKLDNQKAWVLLHQKINPQNLLIIENKIDLVRKNVEEKEFFFSGNKYQQIALSIKDNLGLEKLKNKITHLAGISTSQEGSFSARRRHLAALDKTALFFISALSLLKNKTGSDLIAEDLRLAQQTLGEITGTFTADDLLGEIFSSFCIGK